MKDRNRLSSVQLPGRSLIVLPRTLHRNRRRQMKTDTVWWKAMLRRKMMAGHLKYQVQEGTAKPEIRTAMSSMSMIRIL